MFKDNPKLCVALVLKEYLKRTKTLRNSSSLFITFIRPYKPVSRDTISRWIKTVMSDAGIDVQKFSAHSTRGASTSQAARRNVPLGTILKTAGWTNECTFAKFYKRPVQNVEAYAQAVLTDGVCTDI